jgi:hypothetical protein
MIVRALAGDSDHVVANVDRQILPRQPGQVCAHDELIAALEVSIAGVQSVWLPSLKSEGQS